MSAHKTLDNFLNTTPRRKAAIVFSILFLIALTLYGVFYYGTVKGNGWAESKYLKQREAREIVIAGHEANERQLAAENALLKKQNEAQAEILRANDDKLKGDAVKFTLLQNERNKRYDQIDLDNDFDSQLCAMCADAESSGFKLSANLCGRCKRNP